MSNSQLILSAVTVIALTGIALTSLKYNSNEDDEMYIDEDDNYIDDLNPNEIHSKFHYNVNQNGSLMDEKRVVKRSFDSPIQYSIIDKKLSMIDEFKRQKVKEVHILSEYF